MAETCARNHQYNAAISRSFYSVLQTLIAILMKKKGYDPDKEDKEKNTHEIIRNGIIETFYPGDKLASSMVQFPESEHLTVDF